MAYQKTRWVNNETPLNEGNLNKLEQGVKDAHDVIDQHELEIDNVKDTVYNDHAERISLNESRIEEIYLGGGGGITAFVGTSEEYNLANSAGQISSGTLVIITDEEEIPNSSTTAVLGAALLGSMILGHE